LADNSKKHWKSDFTYNLKVLFSDVKKPIGRRQENGLKMAKTPLF
jgi:hypothetical protein